MGLDMYAYKTKDPLPSEVDFEEETLATVKLFYWRKHPNLHGWMENLYREKGGVSPDFNTNTLQLTATDLVMLKDAVMHDRLPSTSGFFFGNSQSEYKDYDLEFIALAAEAMSDGYSVFYSSWW